METINIEGLGYREINEKLRGTPGCRLAGCRGQRFISKVVLACFWLD